MQEIGCSASNKSIPQQRSMYGFTLIELLVVVTIFAVIAGFTTLAVRKDPHRVLENTAKRFASQFTLISEEAALHGIDYGLRVDEGSYSYLQWEQYQWRVPQDEYFAHEILISQEIEIDLILDESTNLELVSDEDSSNEFEPEDPIDKDFKPPQILILSSGEISPFKIEFRSVNSDDYLEIIVDPLGRTKVERHNAN